MQGEMVLALPGSRLCTSVRAQLIECSVLFLQSCRALTGSVCTLWLQSFHGMLVHAASHVHAFQTLAGTP